MQTCQSHAWPSAHWYNFPSIWHVWRECVCTTVVNIARYLDTGSIEWTRISCADTVYVLPCVYCYRSALQQSSMTDMPWISLLPASSTHCPSKAQLFYCGGCGRQYAFSDVITIKWADGNPIDWWTLKRAMWKPMPVTWRYSVGKTSYSRMFHSQVKWSTL